MKRLIGAFLLPFFVLLSLPAYAVTYALLEHDGSRIIERRDWGFDVPQDTTPGTPNPYWVPIETSDPGFDPLTQVKTGPVTTIFPDKVTIVWTVRQKTAQELADDLAAVQQEQTDRLGLVGFRALYMTDARNRKFVGASPITQNQFLDNLRLLYNNGVPSPDPQSPPTIVKLDASVTIGAIAGASFTDKTFTVTGLQVNDVILGLVFPAGTLPTTVAYQPLRVSAADTLVVRFAKIATGSVTPSAPQSMSVVVWRQ